MSIKKTINNLFPIFFVIIWLMPVSNEKTILNSNMNNFMYIMVVLLVAFAILYDVKIAKKFRLTKEIMKVILVAIILIAFSIPTAIMHPEANFGSREFTFYITLMLILSYRFISFKPNLIWRQVLYAVTMVICISGILMILGSNSVWSFFSTYYVNHYFYAYTEFEKMRKPITFFVANSTTVPIYFLLFMFFEICEPKSKLSFLIRICLISLILFCANNSAIMAIVLIVGYYLFNSDKKMTAKKIILNGIIILVIVSGILFGYTYLSEIILSKANGILGRYTRSGAGNLIVDINYILGFNLPIGCVFLPTLFYADSGPIIYTLMGSILFPVIIYTSLYKALKYYTPSRFVARYLFICLFAFEIAYPILTEQRFLPLFMFFLIYIKTNGKNGYSSVNNIHKFQRQKRLNYE